MTYLGYFRYGDVEIINNSRTIGYSRSSYCPPEWIRDEEDPGLRSWLGDIPYEWSPTMAPPPWAGEVVAPESQFFLGAYCLDASDLEASTYGAESTQVAGRGSIVHGGRDASRVVRFRVALLALNAAGAEYGLSWLTRALQVKKCGVHSSNCGRASLEWLRDRPNDAYVEGDEPPEERYLHNVKMTTPPTVEQKRVGRRREGMTVTDADGVEVFDPNFVVEPHLYIASFYLEAENPTIYSAMDVNRNLSFGLGFVADAPINFMPYPSMEALKPSKVVVGKNWATNPSAEAATTGITGTCTAVSGSNPSTVFSGISTTVTASAFGLRSVVGMMDGVKSGSTIRGRARMTLSQIVDLSSAPMTPVSLSLWNKLTDQRGSGFSVVSYRVYAEWLTSANAVVGSALISTATGSDARNRLTAGYMSQLIGQARPSTAAKIRLSAELIFDWSSGASVATPTVVRFHADAFGVMVP